MHDERDLSARSPLVRPHTVLRGPGRAFLKLISGDGDRDPLCDDYTFSSRSDTTHVIDCDVYETR